MAITPATARDHLRDSMRNVLDGVTNGATTARDVAALASEMGVDMPITRAVCQVLFEDLPAAQAVDALLNREIKAEF